MSEKTRFIIYFRPRHFTAGSKTKGDITRRRRWKSWSRTLPEEIAVTWKTREVSSVNRLMAPPSPANHDGHRSTDQLFSSADPGVRLNCGLAAPCDQNRLEAGPNPPRTFSTTFTNFTEVKRSSVYLFLFTSSGQAWGTAFR